MTGPSSEPQPPVYAQPIPQYAPPGVPTTGRPPVVPPAQGPEPRGLAITAFALGVAACLSSLVPVLGLLIGGVGLVFGILALVKKQPKGFALTGTILSGLGAAASLVMTLLAGMLVSSYLVAVNDQAAVTEDWNAGSDSDSDSGIVPEDGYGSEIDEELGGAIAETGPGSREDPLQLGTQISSDDWDVVVNSVQVDANAEVAAANEFNEPPAAGEQYALVNVTLTYTGTGSSYASYVLIDYVTATGEVLSSWESMVLAPEPELSVGELYTGGSVTGNLVFAIPASADGTIRVQAGFADDEVFVAIK